jgi:mono/diheme cytochrome c family protein
MIRAAILWGLAIIPPATTRSAADDQVPNAVVDVLQRHCFDCHGPDTQEGDLRLDSLGHDFKSPQVVARWRDVADRIRAGDMPPEDQPRPQPAEAAAVLTWIDDGLDADRSGGTHWAFATRSTGSSSRDCRLPRARTPSR